MPLFAICLLVFAVAICIILTARLVRSYPLLFLGLISVVGASVLAIVDGRTILGIFWLLFSAIAAISGALHLYKNMRGAFWWCLAAIIALIIAAVPWEEFVENADSAETLSMLIAPIVFLVIGLLGSLLVPRLMFKDKNQRKHRTNSDLIIGKKIVISKDKEGLSSARGYLNDVDWAIEPLYPYIDQFKLGDTVKVVKIQGVTLMCVRDGKDYRDEQKAKRKEEAEEARRAREEEKARKAAEKAAEEEKAEEPAPEPEPAPVEEPVVEEPAPEPEPQPEPEPEPQPEPEPEPQPEPEPEPQPEPQPEPEPEPQPQPEPEPVPVEEPAPVKEKPEFVPFQARLAQADDFLRNAYNELKSEVLSYGIKSRVSSTGDTFRLHKKAYVKMVVAGKFLKLYLALNPEDYKDTTYPFEDASKLGTKKDTPFVFKIKSGLSIRRAKVLIADAAKKDNLEQKEVIPHDHFADLKEQVAEEGGEEEEAE